MGALLWRGRRWLSTGSYGEAQMHSNGPATISMVIGTSSAISSKQEAADHEAALAPSSPTGVPTASALASPCTRAAPRRMQSAPLCHRCRFCKACAVHLQYCVASGGARHASVPPDTFIDEGLCSEYHEEVPWVSGILPSDSPAACFIEQTTVSCAFDPSPSLMQRFLIQPISSTTFQASSSAAVAHAPVQWSATNSIDDTETSTSIQS